MLPHLARRFAVSIFWIQAAVALVAAPLPVAPQQPRIPARTFDLAKFDARPDGVSDNTTAITRAISAVAAAGGGTLVVGRGTYLTGPLDLCSSLDLRLEAGAVLVFKREPELYRIGSNKYRPLLRTTDQHDVSISGEGTINGGGDSWWAEARRFKAAARAKGARNDTSPRPNLVGFEHCERVRVAGITLTNSPKFNLVPSRSHDVTVDGIKILNPSDSPNTDGIDPAVCERVLITYCRIDTGDDCVAVKAGANPEGDRVRDLLIEHCIFLHGHGCSIGSETGAGVENMLVRDCTFDGTDAGVRLKSDRLRGGLVENVTYENLTMKNVGQAIVITSYYVGLPKPGQHDKAEPVTRSTPIWRRITIRNIVATGGVKNAGLIIGLPEMPVTEVLLENIQIDAPEGLRLAYADNIQLKNVRVTVARGSGLLIEDTARRVAGDHASEASR